MNKLIYIILILLFSLLSGQKFDPTTGELVQDSTKIQLKFDPVTGLSVDGNKKTTQSPKIEQIEPKITKHGYSDFEVIEKAKKDAKTDFEEFLWTAGGGPGSLWASSILGMMTEDIFGEELILPVMAGGVYFIPHAISKINLTIPYYYKLFAKENYTNSQIHLYEAEFKKEIEKLRIKAIRKGQLGTIGVCVGFVFVMIATSI